MDISLIGIHYRTTVLTTCFLTRDIIILVICHPGAWIINEISADNVARVIRDCQHINKWNHVPSTTTCALSLEASEFCPRGVCSSVSMGMQKYKLQIKYSPTIKCWGYDFVDFTCDVSGSLDILVSGKQKLLRLLSKHRLRGTFLSLLLK